MAIEKITLPVARKIANLTQMDLARFCGVSVTTVSSWENHKSEPSISQAKKIGKACGIPYDDIIFLPEDTDKP